MPSYWIARSRILDPERYGAYARAAGWAGQNAVISPQILARGGQHRILEGSSDFERNVLLKFPRFEDAILFYYSSAYQDAAALRRNGAGINELVVTEGIDDQPCAGPDGDAV